MKTEFIMYQSVTLVSDDEIIFEIDRESLSASPSALFMRKASEYKSKGLDIHVVKVVTSRVTIGKLKS